MPVLTDRKNVIIMADEAHRSQYGLDAKTNNKGEVKYGYAKYLRYALPNASVSFLTSACLGVSLKIHLELTKVPKSWSSKSFLSVKTTIVGLFSFLVIAPV